MLSGEPAGTGSSAGFAHVEGGTYLCSDGRPSCDCMDRRGLVCFIFPWRWEIYCACRLGPVEGSPPAQAELVSSEPEVEKEFRRRV
jgi:hypothetical protein